MHNIKSTCLFLILITPMLIRAQEIKIGIQDSVKSSILNEVRPVKIFLPASYDNYKSKKYPVTYILDGDFLYHPVSGMIEYMSKTGQIPEMIIVCLSNTNRTRDFTPSKTNINYEEKNEEGLMHSGGGGDFLIFLNTELIPYINSSYRTTSFNTLIGRSFGGLIGGYDYLQPDSKIDRHILIDPSFWWDDQFVVQQIDNTPSSAIKDKRVYISSSDNFEFSDYIEEMRNSQELFYAKVKNIGIHNSNIKLEYFENETHGTVTIPSLYNGLLFIFENYYLKGMKYKPADEIVEHFSKFSKENNAEFPPLEGMINWLASIQIEKDKNGAIKLYQLNIENYQESVNAHINLAKLYETLEMKNEAIKKYKEALALDDKNKIAIDKIKELEK